jgi:CrcB protein
MQGCQLFYADTGRNTMRTSIIVGMGGFLGTVCRYLLSLIPFTDKTGFLFITLAINVLGAFAIGMLAGLSAKYTGANADLMAFLRVGVCGGFTTFSTFALEITNLFGSGKAWAGATYILLSLILGVAAVLAGKAITA